MTGGPYCGLGTDQYFAAGVGQMEAVIPKLYGKEATEIPGARKLLDSVVNARVPWAIVTSGSAPLATGWLDVMGYPRPKEMVTAESVEHGKPDPACYKLGFERLKIASDISEVVAFEDSPAGIQSAKAAGCRTIGLVTSHSLEQIVAAGADWVVSDLQSVEFVRFEDGLGTLQLSNVLCSK
jgi:glycerol-1-phosphatase